MCSTVVVTVTSAQVKAETRPQAPDSLICSGTMRKLIELLAENPHANLPNSYSDCDDVPGS